MAYSDAFKSNQDIIDALGEGNAHLVWTLAMYLEEPNIEALASEALTDGPDDKKIDFIYFDQDLGRIIFAQGYYTNQKKDTAPSNKAADLNTASAWLFSATLTDVPDQLRTAIESCRTAIKEGEVESIELLYVHNLPESVNVARELQTASAHLRNNLEKGLGITVTGRELGCSLIEHLFSSQESHIEIKDEMLCPAKVLFTETGPKWTASVLTVPGSWLHGLFAQYSDSLFSANYRGFLGITRRRRINTGIRASAESKARDFWVFNNGITLLTFGIKQAKEGTLLTGISIINGAQTTGSIGSVDISRHDLKDVRVLCRVIQCSDEETIGDVVKFNNTQNEITTWDQYSHDPDQGRIETEFTELGRPYSRKRGFRPKGDQIGIEDVAQPLVAFHGRFQEANRGKNRIFERRPLYNLAFSDKKARHILFVHTLARAIDERRIQLKNKSNEASIITIEEQQLQLLRNLRFKSFFIAVIAESLETILGKKIKKECVAFSTNAANAKNHSLIELIAAWSTVVETALTFVASQVDTVNFGERISEETALKDISSTVSAFLYASRNNADFQTFTSMVSDS